MMLEPGSTKPTKDQLRRFRREMTTLIPWVTVLKRPNKRCDAPTSDFWHLGRKTRAALTDQEKETYRCKNSAQYRFRALKGCDGGYNGTYCEIHVRIRGFFASMSEERRFTRWVANNTEIVNRVRIKYGLEPMPTAEEVARARRPQARANA
jgi:hypothetical protein